jgi:hypothetical protein
MTLNPSLHLQAATTGAPRRGTWTLSCLVRCTDGVRLDFRIVWWMSLEDRMHQTCKIVDRVSPLQHPRPASRLPQSYQESALLGTILVCCVPSLRLVLRIEPLDPCLLRDY